MKKAIIILSIIIFLLISFIIAENVYFLRRSKNITTNNDILLETTETNLNDRAEKIENLKKLPEKEKIIKQKKIIEKDTEIITDLKKNLEITNEEIKKINNKKNDVSFFALAGFSIEKETLIISPDIYVGIDYQRNLYTGKKFDIFLGGGLAVKIYQDFGIGGKVAIGFRF